MGCCHSKSKVGPYETVEDGSQRRHTHKLQHSSTLANVHRKEDAVATRYESEVSVLVTDMSGFTRLTRKYGIIHFASLILKMRSICRPIYEAYGALTILTEADNFLVLFPTPEAAVAAALEAKELMTEYVESVDDIDFRPIIGGYGVGLGRDTVLGKNHMLFGEARDVSFRLGEDVASDGELCVDHLVYERIRKVPAFAKISAEKRRDDEDGGDGRVHYVLTGKLSGKKRGAAAIREAASELEDSPAEFDVFTRQMLERLENDRERASLDALIEDTYMKPYAVVVMGLDFAEETENYGVMASLEKMMLISRALSPILDQYSGAVIEDTIFRFDRVEDALAAALDIKALFVHINSTMGPEGQVPFKGFGIHIGSMLLVQDSDVHWGDPLNTSSKLGEDVASEGELFITVEVHRKIRTAKAFKHLDFEKRSPVVSKVKLHSYVVEDPTPRFARAGEKIFRSVKWVDSTIVHTDARGALGSEEGDPIREYPGAHAVLVTDMSGFTRLTRKYGIIHFASLIYAMRAALIPLFNHYGAETIETEADNFFVVFPDPVAAFSAAAQIYPVLDKFNDYVDNPEFGVVMGGVGVGYGENLVQDTRTGKLYGDPVDSAFWLGEEVCEKRQVLVDQAVFDAVRKTKKIKKAIDWDRNVDDSFPGLEPLVYYSASKYDRLKGSYSLADVNGTPPPHPSDRASDKDFFTASINRRLLVDADERDEIDDAIRGRFESDWTAAMVGINYTKTTELAGVAHTIRIKAKAYDIITPIIAEHDGSMEEEGLWIFHSPVAATLAVLDIQAAFRNYNTNVAKKDKDKIHVLGFGVHSGSLLLVKGTNVHWGDPVNTSSKMCEDHAKNGDIYVSQAVHEDIVDARDFDDIHFAPETKEISGVEFHIYKVERSAAGPSRSRSPKQARSRASSGRRQRSRSRR